MNIIFKKWIVRRSCPNIHLHIMLGHFKKSASVLTNQETQIVGNYWWPVSICNTEVFSTVNTKTGSNFAANLAEMLKEVTIHFSLFDESHFLSINSCTELSKTIFPVSTIKSLFEIFTNILNVSRLAWGILNTSIWHPFHSAYMISVSRDEILSRLAGIPAVL